MTFKNGLITQTMAGSFIVIDPARTDVIVKFNETSARIFELLHTCGSDAEAAEALTEEYDIGIDKALADVRAIREKLISLGLAED